jgi:hypothetical protein
MVLKEDLERFKGKLAPDLEDELAANKHYADLSKEAYSLGLAPIGDTLAGMSHDEARHHGLVNDMLFKIGMVIDQTKSPNLYYERGPQGKTQREAVPMPGDIVIAVKSDDVLIKPGAKGIIEGMQGERREEYEVTFNWSPLPWWSEGAISSSGGPTRYLPAVDLKWTGRTEDQAFHFWGPRGAGKDLAETTTHTVLVWEVDLTKYAYGTKKYRTTEQDQRFKYVKHPYVDKEAGTELYTSNTYEITKRHIYELAKELHGLVYPSLKQQYPKFDEETLEAWSTVVISEKRDWFYMDIHGIRFSVGKYTGDTYKDEKHVGKIANLTAQDLFKAM